MTTKQAAIKARTARMKLLNDNRLRLIEAKAAYRKRKKNESDRERRADLKAAREGFIEKLVAPDSTEIKVDNC